MSLVFCSIISVCPTGFYQKNEKRSECLDCPTGWHAVGLSEATLCRDCPTGYVQVRSDNNAVCLVLLSIVCCLIVIVFSSETFPKHFAMNVNLDLSVQPKHKKNVPRAPKDVLPKTKSWIIAQNVQLDTKDLC